MTGWYNLAEELNKMAQKKPFMAGIIFPAGRSSGMGKHIQLSFSQLNQHVNQYAHGLNRMGIQRGERTLVMLKPGLELIVTVFALIKVGAVPILVDPGMGRRAFLQCIAESEPTLMIGIPLGHLIRRIFPKYFKSVQRNILHGPGFLGMRTLKSLKINTHIPFPSAKTELGEEAAVAFTSGGTGIPKGVVYLHGTFKSQITSLKRDLDIEEGEVHLAAMYIFALFNPALGVTTLIPDMDPRKTEKLKPHLLVEAIQTFGVTMSLGSPTVWRIVNEYCQQKRITLPSLKHIFMFGAPVYPELLRSFKGVLPNGCIKVPYGATEALPLTQIQAKEILSETEEHTRNGRGVCVGKPIKGVQIRIIAISDHSFPEMSPQLECELGALGEIAVAGPMVTESYLNRPVQTAQTKIKDGETLWHRMGDLGYLDEKGRLWICGRKAHRIESEHGLLLPICCEPLFNQHPKVFRSALVGVGEKDQQPVIIIEPYSRLSVEAFDSLKKELIEIASQSSQTRHITRFLQYPKFPVDVRHNAKIQRHILADWAKRQPGVCL